MQIHLITFNWAAEQLTWRFEISFREILNEILWRGSIISKSRAIPLCALRSQQAPYTQNAKTFHNSAKHVNLCGFNMPESNKFLLQLHSAQFEPLNKLSAISFVLRFTAWFISIAINWMHKVYRLL